MPRYLVETETCTMAQLHAAVGMTELRYPEVGVESTDSGPVRTSGADLRLVCRAPSEIHVRRWIAASGLVARAITAHPANRIRRDERHEGD